MGAPQPFYRGGKRAAVDEALGDLLKPADYPVFTSLQDLRKPDRLSVIGPVHVCLVTAKTLQARTALWPYLHEDQTKVDWALPGADKSIPTLDAAPAHAAEFATSYLDAAITLLDATGEVARIDLTSGWPVALHNSEFAVTIAPLDPDPTLDWSGDYERLVAEEE